MLPECSQRLGYHCHCFGQHCPDVACHWYVLLAVWDQFLHALHLFGRMCPYLHPDGFLALAERPFVLLTPRLQQFAKFWVELHTELKVAKSVCEEGPGIHTRTYYNEAHLLRATMHTVISVIEIQVFIL